MVIALYWTTETRDRLSTRDQLCFQRSSQQGHHIKSGLYATSRKLAGRYGAGSSNRY